MDSPITQFKSILALCCVSELVDKFVKVYIPLNKNPKSAFIEFSKVYKNRLTSPVLDTISEIVDLLNGSPDLLNYIVQIYGNSDNIIDQKEENYANPLLNYPLVNDIGNFEQLFEKLYDINIADPKSKDVFYNISLGKLTERDLEYKRDHKIKACLEQADKTYISGSYALEKFIESFLKYGKTTCHNISNIIEWKSNDIDVYILNSAQDFHYKIDKVDMVMSKKNEISQLLLSFDLPVNRVVIDKDDNFIVSAECIRAIYTGRYYLPIRLYETSQAISYINNITEIMKVIEKPRENFPSNIKQNYGRNVINGKVKKFKNRISKYQSRGFFPQYVSWIKEHVLFTPEFYDKDTNY